MKQKVWRKLLHEALCIIGQMESSRCVVRVKELEFTNSAYSGLIKDLKKSNSENTNKIIELSYQNSLLKSEKENLQQDIKRQNEAIQALIEDRKFKIFNKKVDIRDLQYIMSNFKGGNYYEQRSIKS